MNKYIIYEQPVAENVRNFLKCEYLYEKYSFAIAQEDIWNIRSSISTLLEISDFTLRINLKIELLKELEKLKIHVSYLRNNNLLEIVKYENYLKDINVCLDNLNEIDVSPSKSIVSNDFLMQIKNKLHIPAGDNFFDMPSYLNFLLSNKNAIVDNINFWYQPFEHLFISSKLILDIKRGNSKFNNLISNGSFFEKKLDINTKIDLVRIKLLTNSNIFPDVSVNRQNINIIFKTSYGNKMLSKAVDENIDFELSLSGIK